MARMPNVPEIEPDIAREAVDEWVLLAQEASDTAAASIQADRLAKRSKDPMDLKAAVAASKAARSAADAVLEWDDNMRDCHAVVIHEYGVNYANVRNCTMANRDARSFVVYLGSFTLGPVRDAKTKKPIRNSATGGWLLQSEAAEAGLSDWGPYLATVEPGLPLVARQVYEDLLRLRRVDQLQHPRM